MTKKTTTPRPKAVRVKGGTKEKPTVGEAPSEAPRKSRKIFVLVGIGVVAIVASFFYFKQAHTSVEEVKKEVLPVQAQVERPFIFVGDLVGGMKVVKAEPYGEYGSTTKLAPGNAKIMLAGPITVTGKFLFETEEGGFSGYCMYDFATSSLPHIPTIPNHHMIANEYHPRFCFRNEDVAKKLLGKDAKTVTVVIDNYELNDYPAEVTDWVDLVEVK